MFHPSKARLTPAAAAADARRTLARLSRPAGAFDPGRYFRGDAALKFHNVGTPAVRTLARTLARRQKTAWTVDDAMVLADRLVRDPYLEVKGFGIEVLACFHRDFTPRLLPAWKSWLSKNYSANWATTDTICGFLIGPLVAKTPTLIPRLGGWARDRNLWVRRASAVGLLAAVRQGLALDAAYATARVLHSDQEDLIQKAVGWLLREAGKVDPVRLERYLRKEGASIPRTTVRYAIERFAPRKRRTLLIATKARGAASHTGRRTGL